jgi:hypothetical protein
VRNRKVGVSDNDIVDLSAQKDDVHIDRTSIDTSLVWGVHDIEVVMCLSSRTPVWVSLQGLEHWQHQRSVNISDNSWHGHHQSERMPVG